jgi:hypothetical protein
MYDKIPHGISTFRLEIDSVWQLYHFMKIKAQTHSINPITDLIPFVIETKWTVIGMASIKCHLKAESCYKRFWYKRQKKEETVYDIKHTEQTQILKFRNIVYMVISLWR